MRTQSMQKQARFFKSISNNAQILLTFDAIEEEQLEAVNEDGTVNEEMVN